MKCERLAVASIVIDSSGSSLYRVLESDGIPVVDGGCSAQVSPIVSLASRKVADPALVLDMDPTIVRYYYNCEIHGKKSKKIVIIYNALYLSTYTCFKSNLIACLPYMCCNVLDIMIIAFYDKKNKGINSVLPPMRVPFGGAVT